MRPLEIPTPSEKDMEALEEASQSTRDVRLHMRIRMVFLAVEQHLTTAAIAEVVRSREEAVRRWLKRWMAEGLEGPKDRPMPGPPPKITEAYRQQLLAVALS